MWLGVLKFIKIKKPQSKEVSFLFKKIKLSLQINLH